MPRKISYLACGASAAAFLALTGAAIAQPPRPMRTPPVAPAKSNETTSPERSLSNAEKATLKACRANTTAATGATAECKAFAAAHPELTTMSADKPK